MQAMTETIREQETYHSLDEVTELLRKDFSRSQDYPINRYSKIENESVPETIRYRYGFHVTDAKPAWEIIAQHAAIKARMAITGRTARMHQALKNETGLAEIVTADPFVLRRLIESFFPEPELLVMSPRTALTIYGDEIPKNAVIETSVRTIAERTDGDRHILDFGVIYGMKRDSIILKMPIEMLAESRKLRQEEIEQRAAYGLPPTDTVYHVLEQYKVDLDVQSIVRFRLTGV